MLLIVGLGNPGIEYEATRHNVGFMLIDRLCEARGMKCSNREPLAAWGEGVIAGREVTLLKPLTYMNRSGVAVAEFSRRLGLAPSSVLVAYDDVDLTLGRLRIRKGGGSGGHRGIESIIQHMGSTYFPRIRLGIGRPLEEGVDIKDYVLSPFTEAESSLADEMLSKGVASIEAILTEGIDYAMNRFNPAG